MANFDRLFELIKQHCTAEQIKGLLRSAAGNKDVRVAAATKDDLVDKNLREAFAASAIDIQRLYDLLREAEENGPQHIFYLRCASREVAQQLTAQTIKTGLLGKSASDTPTLEIKPNGFVVADVRPWGRKKPLDWAMKVYGHESREMATGEVITESDTRILRVFSRQDFRYVLMARWNAPDLLELRVPRDSSTQRIEKWKLQLERTLANVIPLDRFRPWSLKRLSKTLFEQQAKRAKLYTLGDSQLEDPEHNQISFQSYVPEANLFGGLAAQAAAKGLLDNNSTYKQQRVLWLAQEKSGLASDVSTLIGARAENEVVFLRHQTSEGIDYVTEQLRAFNKR